MIVRQGSAKVRSLTESASWDYEKWRAELLKCNSLRRIQVCTNLSCERTLACLPGPLLGCCRIKPSWKTEFNFPYSLSHAWGDHNRRERRGHELHPGEACHSRTTLQGCQEVSLMQMPHFANVPGRAEQFANSPLEDEWGLWGQRMQVVIQG